MPALGIDLSGLWAGVRRAPRFSGSPETVCANTAAPALDGGCIRGFLWALAFEAASLAVVAGLLFGLYRLQR
jgi:hypothetical protein